MSHRNKAKNTIFDDVTKHFDATDNIKIGMDDIYIVWFCKTLQNWKALLSTTLPDGKYYEVTYNGDKKETYVDVYVKLDNFVVKDE